MNSFKYLVLLELLLIKCNARWGKWFWAALVTIVFLGVYFVLRNNQDISDDPVTLIVHSKIARPILGFSINGVAGTNTSAYEPNNPSSGIGTNAACCGVIKGKEAQIIWTLSMTGPQYEAGMRLEKRRVVIPLPERKRGENDLHVHFLPGDKVLLGWSDNA